MRRRRVLAGAGIALAGGAAVVLADESDLEQVSKPDVNAAESQIVGGINDTRADVGVGALERSDHLAAAARDHSADMAARDFFSHQNPDGETPTDRAGCRAGENIQAGTLGRARDPDTDREYDTRETDELAAAVVEGWRHSQGHYEQMIMPRWAATGVGVHLSEDEFFVTAMFC
jgi:uncharacterized protein YkwD